MYLQCKAFGVIFRQVEVLLRLTMKSIWLFHRQDSFLPIVSFFYSVKCPETVIRPAPSALAAPNPARYQSLTVCSWSRAQKQIWQRSASRTGGNHLYSAAAMHTAGRGDLREPVAAEQYADHIFCPEVCVRVCFSTQNTTACEVKYQLRPTFHAANEIYTDILYALVFIT